MIPQTGAEIAALIQMALVPVIMINAIGLICLVIQNRHAAVVDRIYRLNRERVRLHDIAGDRPGDARRQAGLARQIAELSEMTHLWVRRGHYTRNALAAAFLGITLFGLTSLWLVGAALLGSASSLNFVGVALFVTGMLSFLAAFWFILNDLLQSLSLSRLDTERTDRYLAEERLD